MNPGVLFGALALSLVLISNTHAQAAKPSQVAWDLKTVNFVTAGKAERGKTLHAACAGCHGENGIAPSGEFPDLAGQDALYLYKQLHDYKSGARASAVMADFVGSLSAQDMADLAQFYAKSKRPPATLAAVADDGVMTLVRSGDGGRLIVGCAYCHGDAGRGNAGMYGMPVLQGQKGSYLQQTLQSFASGTRHNDVYGAMRQTVKRLTPAEIAGLASYYSGTRVAPLAPPTPSAPAAAASAAATPASSASSPTPAASAAPAKGAAAAGSDGWYTEAQADEGAKVYATNCAGCHGANLQGVVGPALVGRPFWTRWGAKPFRDVFNEVHKNMGKSPAVSVEALAYVLKKNGVPAGRTALNDTTDLTRALPAR